MGLNGKITKLRNNVTVNTIMFPRILMKENRMINVTEALNFSDVIFFQIRMLKFKKFYKL